jgi:tetratricopeptide (TPR) repeat protein
MAESDRSTARQLVQEGMEVFREGNVRRSIELFDQAESLVPGLAPFLWQRGISYYYDDQFQKASTQFRTDVQVNPLDVEEIVWDAASQLRIHPDEFPVPAAMSLPTGKQDRRNIMNTVYRLFRGEGTEQDLAVAGHASSARYVGYRMQSLGRLPPGPLPYMVYTDPSMISSHNPPRSIADEFYALFYLGLFCEARGEMTKAATYMRQAVRTNYARTIGRGDYMTSVARVHCMLRGW